MKNEKRYYYIEYETGGGVDVIPLEAHFQKTCFSRYVPDFVKTAIFGVQKNGFFTESRPENGVTFWISEKVKPAP